MTVLKATEDSYKVVHEFISFM